MPTGAEEVLVRLALEVVRTEVEEVEVVRTELDDVRMDVLDVLLVEVAGATSNLCQCQLTLMEEYPNQSLVCIGYYIVV